VERWWTREEKARLGIEDENGPVSAEDFVSNVDSAASDLLEFKEKLGKLEKSNEEYVKSKTASLADENLFELFVGNRLLKRNHFNVTGEISAYSTNVFDPFLHVKETNINDFNAPYVIWGIDGKFEFNVIEPGIKFATTDHCGAIKIKTDKINPHFLAYKLGQIKHLYGFDRGLRASLRNMKKIEISIPVDDNNDFDLNVQRVIAKNFILLNSFKKNLKEINDRLNMLTTQEVSLI
jgi:hypothetical protein